MTFKGTFHSKLFYGSKTWITFVVLAHLSDQSRVQVIILGKVGKRILFLPSFLTGFDLPCRGSSPVPAWRQGGS